MGADLRYSTHLVIEIEIAERAVSPGPGKSECDFVGRLGTDHEPVEHLVEPFVVMVDQFPGASVTAGQYGTMGGQQHGVRQCEHGFK